jgi:hypothetical protein
MQTQKLGHFNTFDKNKPKFKTDNWGALIYNLIFTSSPYPRHEHH